MCVYVWEFALLCPNAYISSLGHNFACIISGYIVVMRIFVGTTRLTSFCANAQKWLLLCSVIYRAFVGR